MPDVLQLVDEELAVPAQPGVSHWRLSRLELDLVRPRVFVQVREANADGSFVPEPDGRQKGKEFVGAAADAVITQLLTDPDISPASLPKAMLVLLQSARVVGAGEIKDAKQTADVQALDAGGPRV